ncbi:hypothetical protein DAI22_12g076300 [Oryza sativa Japonica Group]|nr:hypothetical protein DAI22_12g076300 [Oryza sativa Japonica Group]
MYARRSHIQLLADLVTFSSQARSNHNDHQCHLHCIPHPSIHRLIIRAADLRNRSCS